MNLRVLIVFSILTLMLFSPSCRNARQAGPMNNYMNVKRVVDGDTFVADDGSEKGITVRLIGVDAPESRNTRQKKIGYYGEESKKFLTQLLSGKKIRLEYDVGKYDRYQRILAYVWLEDGTFVNEELLKRGYAMVMTVPPNVKYAERFVRVQRRARIQKRGLWEKR